MARHASWKGFLKLSLASIPVQAFTAAAGADSTDISFNQLHAKCMNRINYKKVCPVHGEVPNSEIVSGYEYAKGQYIVIDKDELSSIASDLEKSLTIECFVPPETIGPEFAAGQSYYLVPDGRVGQKPYALVCEALNETGMHGIGEMVISRKQRLVRMRAVDKLIVLDVLHYEGELHPVSDFSGDVPDMKVEANELKLAKSLIEQMEKPEFDATLYQDDYSTRLRDLISAKLKGHKVSVPQSQPDVINFMDALQRSVKAIPVPGKKAARAPKEKAPALKSTARHTRPVKRAAR